MTQLRPTPKEIVMDVLRFGIHRLALRAVIATAAILLGATAHAQDPCEQGSTQDPTLQVLSQGIRVPLKFGGCWQPESVDEGDSEAFAGINGELLGRIVLSFTHGRVSIANREGSVRSLDVITGYSPTHTAAAQGAAAFAYWEDQTLVLRTNGLERNTVTVTERISLKNSDTMEYAMHVVTLSQPSTPITIKILYHRAAARNNGSLPCS
jgi:hypothetical protein